jgi:predicted nuclease with TOPRIM domain
MTVVKPIVNYRHTLDSAIKELADLMEEREKLDERREALHERIVKLRRVVWGLASLCDVENIDHEHPSLFPDEFSDTADVGLTDAIRQVLSSHEEASLSPVFIRDRLADVGFDIKTHKNILASIHTVLKRLQRQGEAIPIIREGRTAYKWVVKKKEETPELSDEDIPF